MGGERPANDPAGSVPPGRGSACRREAFVYDAREMKSMTGFGRGESVARGTCFRVEISSVNRKQADISVNLPRELAELEVEVREAVAARITRGRVSVKVTLDTAEGEGQTRQQLRVDRALAKAYAEAFAGLRAVAGEVPLAPLDLLRAPGVFVLEEVGVEPESAAAPLRKALAAALAAFDRMRQAEGAELKKDLGERLAALHAHGAAVAERAPAVVERYRNQLRQRLDEAGVPVDLDDERVLREIGLFAERSDISEELTRLESHLKQFARYLRSRRPMGRAMDFLAQELNREVNTIGSKANSAEIARHVVEAKGEIEKIREQVQNVE